MSVVSVLLISLIGASLIGFSYAGYTYIVNTRHPSSDHMGAAIIYHRIWRRSAVGVFVVTAVMLQPWYVSFGTFVGTIIIGYLLMPVLERCGNDRS